MRIKGWTALVCLAITLLIPVAVLSWSAYDDGYHDAQYGFIDGTDDNHPTPAILKRLPMYNSGEKAFLRGKGQVYWSNGDQQNETCGLASTQPDKYDCSDGPNGGSIASPKIVNDGDLPEICFDRRHQAERCHYIKGGNWTDYGILMRWRLKNLATGKIEADGLYEDAGIPVGVNLLTYKGIHQKWWSHPVPFARLAYPQRMYAMNPCDDSFACTDPDRDKVCKWFHAGTLDGIGSEGDGTNNEETIQCVKGKDDLTFLAKDKRGWHRE